MEKKDVGRKKRVFDDMQNQERANKKETQKQNENEAVFVTFYILNTAAKFKSNNFALWHSKLNLLHSDSTYPPSTSSAHSHPHPPIYTHTESERKRHTHVSAFHSFFIAKVLSTDK